VALSTTTAAPPRAWSIQASPGGSGHPTPAIGMEYNNQFTIPTVVNEACGTSAGQTAPITPEILKAALQFVTFPQGSDCNTEVQSSLPQVAIMSSSTVCVDTSLMQGQCSRQQQLVQSLQDSHLVAIETQSNLDQDIMDIVTKIEKMSSERRENLASCILAKKLFGFPVQTSTPVTESLSPPSDPSESPIKPRVQGDSGNSASEWTIE